MLIIIILIFSTYYIAQYCINTMKVKCNLLYLVYCTHIKIYIGTYHSKYTMYFNARFCVLVIFNKLYTKVFTHI